MASLTNRYDVNAMQISTMQISTMQISTMQNEEKKELAKYRRRPQARYDDSAVAEMRRLFDPDTAARNLKERVAFVLLRNHSVPFVVHAAVRLVLQEIEPLVSGQHLCKRASPDVR